MSSCCNGPQNRKVKEWGTVDKESKSNSKIKILITLALVIILGYIILR